MYSPIQTAILFLLDIAFSLYIFAVLLRIIFQIMRVNFYNPIAQAIVKLTNPVLVPMRRVIPGYRGHDIAAFLLVLLLQIFYLLLILLIKGAPFKLSTSFIFGLVILSIGSIISTVLSLYTWTLIISIILSWIAPMHPITGVLGLITDPLLKPIRRKMPNFGILDLSPMVLLIIIQLCKILISEPILAYGQATIFF